jgi:transcription antitermination factor NusG
MSLASWYALTVKPRHERTTAQHLHHLGLEEFCPTYKSKRRWHDRTKDLDVHLFPGYVFCRFSYPERLSVLNTPGVTAIVGFGKTPAPIPPDEIGALQQIVASGAPAAPWPYVRIGQKVRIEEGVLSGVTGTLLREKDVWRVVVCVELLQRSVAVEIDRRVLSPVETQVYARLQAQRPDSYLPTYPG